MLNFTLDCLFSICCCGVRYLKHSDSSVDIAKEFQNKKEYNELLDQYTEVKRYNKNFTVVNI